MKSKAILVSFIALFAIIFAMNVVMAASSFINDSEVDVTVNDVPVG